MEENLIRDNGIYNYDALDFLHALYEDYGDESIDMFLCDFPYTFKVKNRVTANKWDLPIDDKEFFDIAMKMLVPDGCIALTASQPFTSYLVMNHLDYFKYEWIVNTDQTEHTARRFSAWLPPIQCTLSGHQCMLIIQV